MERKLTRRQREILELLCQGMTISEIAAALYITISTVRQHLSFIYNRLNIKTQAQAVIYYLKQADNKNIHENLSLLTRREQQVYALYKQSLSIKQIGIGLSLSPSTVRVHLKHIRDKLEVDGNPLAK